MYLTYIGFPNHPVKVDAKIVCTLQTNLFRIKIQKNFLQKLYELTISVQSYTVEYNVAN